MLYNIYRKKEENKKMKTVNEVKRAYTFYLEGKLGKIYSMAHNKNVSLEAMKNIVKSYTKPATYSYPIKQHTKLKWFKETVDSITSKTQLYYLCRNSVNKARLTEAR